jgi:glycine/D-amino acid oxidase-like deaminating enzyme
MVSLFPDWKDSDATAVLHEFKGGFAYSRPAIDGLAELVAEQGIPIISGVEVTGFEINPTDDTVSVVQTSRGPIEIDSVVVAVGPWVQNCWSLLQLPSKIDVRNKKGDFYPNRDMWTFWQLQEGEITLERDYFTLPDGSTPPTMHIDSEDPLFDESGQSVTDGPWGIYFKRDHGNVQGGAVPYALGTEAEVDPYGPASPHYTVDPSFVRYWTAGLARSLKRFEGCRAKYRDAPSGGIGCFSVDNFPVFDYMRPNVFVIADSNHGFKMIGVGKEVAATLMGQKSRILAPFRFSRFVEGELHPASNSPFPWA